ncbi:MAG: helix-turn-helix domain-containing protein [Gemmatimonadetes bacterium]|nr:helix-turn-helix domain-containing protein [Gemmatimonadota bacterium]
MRRVHLTPYTELLERIGAPVDRLLSKAGLPLREQPGAVYVSNRRYFEFLDLAARSQGIRDLGYQAGMRVGRSRLSKNLATRIDQAPSLYVALKCFQRDIHADANRIVTALVERDDRLLFVQRSSSDAGPVGWETSEQLVAMMFLDIVRHFAGEYWFPAEVSTRSEFIPLGALDVLPDTKWRGGELSLLIPVPRHILFLPPQGLPVQADERNVPPPLPSLDDFTDTLREVLKGHLADGTASLELAADIVGTAPRTLQRMLAGNETSFSEVVDRARYEVASSLMADPTFRIADVAHAAGYKSPTNFSRAFRRVSGVTPREYRRLQR